MIDNIYEHSEFQNAIVMAQRYEQKKFVEICFFDDGIGIPGSFKKKGITIEDHQTIVKAINGYSTKSEERGYGISSNLRIFTEGMDGEVLVVSGLGAVYIGKSLQKVYKLQDQHQLTGTMISIRISYPAKKVDLHDYIG